jgi:hypothetical protein
MGKQLILVVVGHAHMVTLANLHKFIEKGHRVAVIDPSPHHYCSGMGTGILHKKWLTPGGRLAFIIKDYIDRKFMKKFQSFE